MRKYIQVIYHNKDIPLTNRLQKVIDDAVKLLPKCRDEYADTEDFQLLERAIREQTRKDDNGGSIPKGKGEGMDSSTLQNPADPDATYRLKAGKSHRGYIESLPVYEGLRGILVTRDAHSLYRKFGYEVVDGRVMIKGLNC